MIKPIHFPNSKHSAQSTSPKHSRPARLDIASHSFHGFPNLACLRCKHHWVARRHRLPKYCPGCHSPYWHVERGGLVRGWLLRAKHTGPLEVVRMR
jgi:hypothetical protein